MHFDANRPDNEKILATSASVGTVLFDLLIADEINKGQNGWNLRKTNVNVMAKPTLFESDLKPHTFD